MSSSALVVLRFDFVHVGFVLPRLVCIVLR